MLKKFGKKITKKSLLIAGGIAIALVVIIIAIAIVSSKGEKTKKNSFTPDSELARAMTYGQFTDADSSVDGTDYVKFGAFFLRDINNDGYAEKIKGTCKQVGKEDTLYMELNVLTNGYLENGVITINSDNFYLQTTIPKDNEVKDNVISNNAKQISLNQINNGTQKLLTGIVRTGDYSYDSQKFAAIGNDTTKMSKVNSVTLTGTHVAADGTRTQINKTVEFNMDWYGTTKTEIPNYIAGARNLNQSKDNTNVVDEENKQAVFEFDIGMQETNNQLILSKAHLEGTIPQLNGYDPSKVEILDSNATFSYEEATKTFQAEKLTELNTDRTVSKQCYDGTYYDARYNKFKLKVVYPLEAYNATGADTVEIKIPVSGYYEGYNNTNSEFKNLYKSNIAKGTVVLTYSSPTGTVARFDVTVGKYISSPSWKYIVSKKNPLKIYNEISTEENNDTYIVNWYGATGSDGQSTEMTMAETKNGESQVSDQFIKADSTAESMENITTNIGIYFGNPVNLLGEDGWIKVYDAESNNLLHEFTKSDWSKYSESNPYKYDTEVKHIKIVTSETNASNSISVYHVKKLDDEYITTNYTREQFDNLKYIKSTLTGYVGENYINTDTHSAYYEAPYSLANINISKSAISTQETEKNMQITIETVGDENANQEKWQNGTFLVKLPKDIIDIDVSSVESSNSSVTVMSYESYEENGERFIKIITSNPNPTAFTLKVNCSITPDPRIATTTESIELYASNENGVDYYNPVEDIYDVNDNLNQKEKVNKSTISINLISPNSLLTNQIATNYDENGSTVVAPQVAVVSKERRTATVNVEINNNYSSTISEVKILGRVPFEGNKYTINGENMGSTFTATMANEGIQLPTALKGVAKVYYSTNGEATQDLTNAQNGWTQSPSDYSKVKSYLIDLGDHQLAKGEKHTISYNINIPAGLSYNKVAYSHHAVYFSLDTTEGKYRTQTEPNKIGFMIAKQYDLELTKFQKNKSKIVSGATYAIYEDGNEEARTRVTGIDGKLKLTGLYVDKTYVVKEIKSPTDYELNEEVVKFTTSESDGKLSVTKNEGTVKNIQAVQASEDKGYKVQIEVEDEAKAKLKIKKTEKGTATPVARVGYKLIGAGLPDSGKNVATNSNGEVIVKGLKIGEEYILEETKADGYYVAKGQIKFTVTNTNGTYTINVSQGTVKASNITEEDNIPTVNIELEDEKIPTYNLEISKIQRITSTAVTEDELKVKAEQALSSTDTVYLVGAKFKLYKGTKELGNYITDGNGKITLNNLYQYIDGKDEEATYTLKEILSPEGYSKVKDIIFKVDGSTGELKFINTEGKEESYTVENNTVKLLIEDSPSFKLIKKDAETSELLANIKFAIYNIDAETQPAKNSKGEIIGTKEIINGREYYTVTTDSKGEITADLPEGMYKAVEVQAPDKYDISDSTYYFGIGTSREGKEGLKAIWAQGIGGDGLDSITSVAESSDGGYIVGGHFKSSNIDLGNGIILTNKGEEDGMVIKYDAEGEAEWAKEIGGEDEDSITSVARCSDGGYIVGGYFYGSSIDLGNGIILTNKGYSIYSDGMVIKYSSEGEVEWAKVIGGKNIDYIRTVSETTDGGYIVGGSFADSINLGNGISFAGKGYSDGMVIKYSSKGEIEWAKAIGGDASDYIISIVECSDGGYIVGGEFGSSSIDLENEISLKNKSSYSGFSDGMVIKYDAEGKIEWAKGICGTSMDEINSVEGCSDGGYIVVGSFSSSSIDLGNGTSLTNKGNGNGSDDGMLIKYSSDGEVEWAKTIGGTSSDCICSVEECSDGGYIIGGYFESRSIDLGNGVSLTNKSDGSSKDDGMVIKYSSNGEAEWAEGIGGADSDYINSVVECRNGGYIVEGRFKSSSISLKNGISLINKGSDDGMVIKLEKTELPNPTVIKAQGIGETDEDKITSVAECSDGGYIAGGYFKSSSIDLENGISLTNKGFEDGIVIKYSSNGEVEWAQGIGETDEDKITSVAECSDGGYIAGGYFKSSSIDLENGISLTNKGFEDGMVIKYSSNGKVEWAQGIGGTSWDYINSVAGCSDGGYIVVGDFASSNIDLGNGISLTNKGEYDGMVIKYSQDGEVEWAQGIGGANWDYINSVVECNDGGYIVGGNFNSTSIDLGNGVNLTNKGNYDGMVIKYDAEGEVEWAKGIGGISSDSINSVAVTRDGGYIVGGSFESSSIDLGNGISLASKSSEDGMLIKYSSKGEVEWAKGIGGNGWDYIDSVVKCSDGGYIVGGSFESSSIDLGNGISLANKGEHNGEYDGMVIKYNEKGEVEWAKGIDGTNTDYINSVVECNDGGYIVGGSFESSSIDLGNEKTLINNGSADGMILKITNQLGVPEVQELEVANSRKKFKITTDVNEIDNIKGGSISGEDRKPYESVMYGESSTKEIKMIPDENYEIIEITVNGKEYSYSNATDGSYTMPIFTNMAEDKHIVVTYALKDNKIIINKVDKNTRAKLSGAEFKLDQIEERSEPNNSEIIGSLTDNGQEYTKTSIGNEITGKLGELTNNGTYYFIQNADGTYTPTNSKTYQTANGGTAGIQRSTANSYIPIDLTGLTGQYAIVVNASCSSESADKGYVAITENTTAVSNSQTGKLIYIYGTQSAKDYTSAILEGGKTYYLHMGYYKDSSVDRNDDQIVINSIKLYSAENIKRAYNFVNNNEKYESTNQGKDDTTCNSYIPIDLTNYTGKYNLTVNAEVSSESSDYGYATVTENTTRPSYSSSTGRFVYISGTQSAKDYTAVLQGGKMYYLHFGYYKNSSISLGDDKFTINSVNVSLNSDDLYHTTVQTNSDGQAITQIPFGKYSITETEAPGEYILNSSPTVVEFRSTDGAVHEFTIENEEKAKLVVHHFIKGTTTKVAEDENLEGTAGEKYATNAKLDLSKYELEKDSNGAYVLPANATGTYKTGTTEVTYYYVEKQIPLTVHHYIEGTTDKVPLKAGGTADDVTGSGKEGESYTTSAIADDKLSNEYELVEAPSNASGTYSGNEVIVTYYYKKVSRKVNLVKYQQDGKTPLQGAKFTIKNANSSEEKIVRTEEIQNNGTYYFENKAGKYVSNNKNQSSTTANSYIKIDTSNAVKDTTVKINAEISSESGYDIGYAAITETENAPSYDNPIGRFINISGIQSAKDYIATLEKGKVYYLHLGYRKDGSGNTGTDTFTVNSIKINNIDYLEYSKIYKIYITNEQGKIQTNLEAGTYEITEIEAPDGYKLPANPTTKVTITKATPETINITNEKKTGTVTVHHYIEGTTTKVPLAAGGTAADEVKTGNVGDIYATKARTDISNAYELVSEPSNGSGTYIDGNIEVIYYYKSLVTSVLVHHYLEGTTTKLADDVIFEGSIGDNYTTGVATVDSKYEVVAIPANANGKMTREQTVVIYYYRVKDTSVLVHHYKEGTSESLSKDVTITGKVDDAYTTSVATDIPSKYELVATPTNASGKMTVAQTVVTYYYRLKATGVDVHYYKEGTTEKVSNDVAIEGKVDQSYTTTPATDVASKYELVGTPTNATGTMTEDRITVIYYYRLKNTSVLVHHYLEGTTTKLADDVTIKGKVDDTYKTVENTELLAGKYELVAEPTNKSGTMTEAQIVVIYYYRVKDTSVLVHHYIKGTTTSLSADVAINGKIDDKYTTTKANDIPEQYELVTEPTNKSGTMTEEQIVVTYYYQLKNYPYTVNYLEKGTGNVLHDAKQGGELVYGSTVKSSDEKIDINGYNFDSYDKETLTIGTTGNVINIYYIKRTDLSYKVNYLEKGTNKVLHDQKVQGGMTFESEVTSSDEVIDIDGYNYDSVDKVTLKITTGENVINIYYTKRNDLSYTVNYLEKDTNKVLHNPKNQTEMTFGTVITSSNEVIEIDGYNYDSVDKNSIVIGTSENVINIYYTKRNDLSYKVNYLEKTTNKVLHDQKVQGGMTFESVVTSANEVIDIDGYNYDSVDKATLTITTGENIINIYYTKRNDLSYTVNYLEKTTNKVLHNPKTVENKTFGDVIKSADEKIDIDGYNYDSVDKDTLKITTGENVINIYYTKRNDLSYKVNYLEKTTNKVLHDPKVQDGMTFESVVTSANEVIDIDGYNYDSVDKDTLTITTGENVINIYYTKRNDLSYKVNYLEKTTNKVLHDQKVQDGMTFEAEVKSADEVIDINGYKFDSADKESIKITIGENVINIYYTKVDGLSYTVNYLDKNTNEVINPAKTKDGMTFEDVVTSRDEIISIDGYNYDSVDKDTLTIGTGENVINIYYTKRTDLSYKVNYLEKGTNKVLHDQKVQENMTFKATVKSSDEVIDIDGYDYDSVDKDTLTITTGENVINIYYTKRTDLLYKVNYLEKETNKVLHDQKVQDGMTFESVVTSANEVIDIDGYNYDSVDKATLTIGTEENVINIYYTKRTDLSYKVNYLEKETNKVLHNQKVQDGMTFESVVTSANEVIDIDGYNYDSVDKDTLTITTGENIINIYYTKRNDLSYTVNYLEKNTNIVLHEPKVTENMTFEAKVTSANEVIDIDGYNYDSVDKDSLTITTGTNLINIYYTKRNDLSYTVNYLEKGTNKVLNAPKVTNNMIFGTVVTSKDEVIKINGYNYDSVDKDSLIITTGTNVINVYYTKVTGLSYTVNYLDKDTDEVIHPSKTTGEQVFEKEITSADEVIDIDGYNYDSVDKDKLIIGTGENVINIYYTKRNDLSYTVNYLEKDTNKVLQNPKNQTGMTFGNIITSSDEIIDIDGYDYNSVDKNSISIGTKENVINIYYTKRNDLSYKVNYLEKTTNKVLHDQKVQGGMTFESVVTSANEVIDIDGYNYDSVDKATLTITTGENIINIYYTKRNDLSYTVNYLEKTTNKVLHNPKTVENKTFGDVIKSADEKIDIDGYNYDSVDKDTLKITTGENVINIYYTKRNDLSYKVNYLEKTTNKVLHDPKVQDGMTFESVVTSANEVIDIDGYNYDSVDKDTLTITTGENVINIYYTKRNDLSYTVNYLEKGTNKVLHDQKVQDGMTFETEVKSADEVIDINGYKFDSADKESIKITIGENVINIYYTKVDGLSYTVNYLEKGTNEVINPAKTKDGMTFEDVVTSQDEVIAIDGYNYDSVDKDTLTIGTGENVINIYYTKRTDLSYKVNYLEKTTNKVLHDQKVQENMTFKATVKSSDEVIDIDGYDYDSVDKDTLTITTGENVINIYYTKRTDLLYKVNYLEKETNKVLHDQKVQDGMTFESVVTSANEVIDIDGYNYDSVDKATLTIGTEENVINIYYTKRTDLSYKVNYLEKETNKVLHNQKVQDGMTFESVVTSANEVIDIDGYNYDSVDKDTLTITTGENVINIYYTKRNDLSYKVNYLEKDTNIVLHEPKVIENMTFEAVIESRKEVIDIDGYNYDSVDKDTLVIGTGENIINIYYTKRNDLSYTVNYLEKGTNRTIHAPKVTQNMTFGTEITSSKEVIPINGYSYDSVDKDTLTIGTGENVINIYYTKVSGLSYTVNYLEKDTNEVLQAPKTKGNMTFENEIISSDEVIEIDGYNYDSVDKDKLVIGTGENVINIYYTKRNNLSYKVNYLEKDTNKVLHEQKVQDNMTFEDVVTSSDEIIEIDGYNYDSVDKDTLTITTGENVINIYYTKRNDLSYKVNYLEKGTNKVLHDSKSQGNMTFESTVKSSDEVIDINGYNYDSVDKDTLTITTGENVINIYYTKKDTKVTVHYYEEGTTNKVSEDVEIPGKVFDNYETESASDIPSKYELVAEPDNKNGTMTEDEITVIYYYRKKATQVIVHYYEENTTKKLSEDITINGKVDDSYTTVSATDVPIKYELVATPSNANGSMTEATIEVIYYYRVKDAVINVRYLEKGTEKVLADSDRIDGKVDDDYQTTPKVIDGYQLVEHTGNEKGKFEVEPITITYYYLYKTKATVQYIDKTTGQILEQSTTKGLEGDDFVTESKDFENYVLVEEPAEKTVKMTKEEQILKYYYIHVSGGVIEKHIDVISGQILANAVHNGNEGDAYDIPSRTFEGYDLVEDRLPANSKGTMKVEPVEVIYYYIYRSKVTAEYIDKNTGSKLTDDVTQNGHEGDNYTTERKTFDDYKLVEVPSNADGSMTKEDIKVTYYYVHTSGGVIVNHIDIKTDKQLLDETKEEGYEGDPYKTHEENISGYDLVKEKYPENATGKMTIEPTRVTYYYIKKTEVNVKYVDKETGEEIDESTNIPGHEGDDYTTEPKDVPGYDLIEEPENKDGTMTADPINVIYYYKRPAKVIVNYYDIDTKEKLADEIEITGHQNDEYTTEQKDIKYYEIAKIPENKEGKMVVTVTKDENGKEIVEDTTYVNYYYRKLIFNLRVDKTIASVIVNGQETTINGNLGKVEVHRKNISTANVKVVYKIKVTNDSELTGKANVVENIPSGMTMKLDNNPGWTINETTASIETDEIKPGESREYQVVLGWQNGDSNIGTKENVANIVTENEAGFNEKDTADNESRANLIVAVGTGEVPYVAIAGSILIIMIAITSSIYVIKKKRQ